MLLLINLLIFRGQEDREAELRLHRSSFNPGPSGLKAFYLLLQKQGFKLKRWSESWEELPADSRLLLVADPEKTVTAKEWENLFAWVSQGNTAAFFLDRGETLKPWDLNTRYQRLAPEEIRLKDSYPLTFGIKTLIEKGNYRLASSRQDLLILVEDPSGPLIVLASWGKGKLLLVSSAWLLSNAGLGEGDNYLLGINLVRLYSGGLPVLFDEYHHGYGSQRSLGTYLGQRPLFWSLVQLMILALLFIYVQNVRLGKAKTLQYEERRSAGEYVESMANIYRLAKAETLALETLYRSFLRDAGKSLGCPPSIEPSQLAELLQRRGIGEHKAIENSLRRIETLIEQGHGNHKEIYSLSVSVEEWRRKLKGL